MKSVLTQRVNRSVLLLPAKCEVMKQPAVNKLAIVAPLPPSGMPFQMLPILFILKNKLNAFQAVFDENYLL